MPELLSSPDLVAIIAKIARVAVVVAAAMSEGYNVVDDRCSLGPALGIAVLAQAVRALEPSAPLLNGPASS